METDFDLRFSANNLVKLLSAQCWPVWRHEFDVSAPGTPSGGPTPYGTEISYIFDRQLADPTSQELQLHDD